MMHLYLIWMMKSPGKETREGKTAVSLQPQVTPVLTRRALAVDALSSFLGSKKLLNS